MDLLYSYLLLISLVVGGAGTVVALISLRALPGPERWRSSYPGACLVCGLTALASGSTSAIVHLYFGHSPSTPEPMRPWEFALFHKAFWVALALGAISIVGWWRARGPARP